MYYEGTENWSNYVYFVSKNILNLYLYLYIPCEYVICRSFFVKKKPKYYFYNFLNTSKIGSNWTLYSKVYDFRIPDYTMKSSKFNIYIFLILQEDNVPPEHDCIKYGNNVYITL